MNIKINGGGGRVGGSDLGGGVRMDVNEELKFCENSKKKYFFRGGGVGLGGGGQGRCEQISEVFVKNKLGGGGGVRVVDVNEELKFL